MNATIYSNSTLIGHAELTIGDESMGCVYGKFVPTEAYYNIIQKSVWDFWRTGELESWHSLRFNVQLDNGFFLYPIGGYTIDDIQELPDEPKRIDIAGLDRHVIEDFFLSESPQLFVQEPWVPVDVTQKLSFEGELRQEIGADMPGGSGHLLAGFDVSALAKALASDDVLFAIHRDYDHLNQGK